MQRTPSRKLIVSGILAIFIAVLSNAFAQVVTTSTLSGTIVSEQNKPVKGAAITITHEPTGIEVVVTSQGDGSFAASGLRPGGPYAVSSKAAGFVDSTMKEVYLEIDRGSTITLKAKASDVVVMDKFVVATDPIEQLFDVGKTGSGTYMSQREIAETPIGDRSINSLVRMDPRITYNRDPNDRAFTVSGLNNRYNSIQVDGVSASDPFGLNSNNTAAERNAIPLDSLEALSINTSPYNARNGGFVGAQVNATTKSGTNTFHGSLYYTFRGNSLPVFGKDVELVGDRLNKVAYPLSNFQEETMGLTLSGPIIPKKLFFFLSYEKVDEDKVATRPTTMVDSDTIQKIVAAAKSYGFETGSATPPSGNQLKDDNVIAKLDWQINNAHRASFRFNNVKSSRPTFPGFGTSTTSQNNFSFESAWYKQEIENTSYIAQLISRWNEKLDTELSVSHSKYHAEPKNNSSQPYVEIRNVPVTGSTYPSYVTFGTEYSRHTNILDVKTNTAELFGTYKLAEKHTLQAGFQYEASDVFNDYVQYSKGYYQYGSLDDFLNKAAAGGLSGPTSTSYQYNQRIPGVNSAGEFQETNVGFFINDKYRINSNLTLDLGARIDMPLLPDAVPFNQKFYNTFGVRNDHTYDGKKVFQPRIGFNYTPNFSKKTLIRGGVGLFYGRAPRVWVSNSYSNTGMNYVTYQSKTLPAISADPTKQATTGSSPAQTVAFMDPGLQLPSRYKSNLAFEREMGFLDLKFSAEAELTVVKKDIFVQNINLSRTGFGPDGRELYFSTLGTSSSGTKLVSTDFNARTIKLMNTDQGNTQSVTFALERPRKSDGWYWRASYTSTHAYEVLYTTSSVASSNWSNRAVFNNNNESLHTASLEVRDRILFNLAKDFQFVKGYKTTMSLLYEGRSGYPFSFTANGDMNGDGQTSNDLLYIPRRSGDSNVRFATEADRTAFFALVDRFNLQEGAPMQENGCNYPWVNTFDISIKQQIKLPGWRHRLTLGLDILNVGNLLNNKWGIIRGSNQFYTRREQIATVAYDATAKQYVYSKVNTGIVKDGFSSSTGRGEPAATRWSALLSARYEF